MSNFRQRRDGSLVVRGRELVVAAVAGFGVVSAGALLAMTPATAQDRGLFAERSHGGPAPAGAFVGHPTEDMLIAAGIAGGPQDPVLEDPPLVSGSYINFESPPVKPLAFHEGRSILVATNTPNNSVVVFAATPAGLQFLREIPVGLEPVSVAFQPGTGGEIVFVANHLSDNVAKVDIGVGQVVAIAEVGDEPVNILFNTAGSHAFVVCQDGRLVTLDAATMNVAGEVTLDCNTPRAAAYDPTSQRLYVAALHSGNNTTVIGAPWVFRFDEPCTPDCPVECINADTCRTGAEAPVFAVAIVFSVTAALFQSTPMYPWPSAGSVPGVGSPPALRITTDKGVASPYQQIVELLSNDDGTPDQGMVNLFVQEWLDATGQVAINIFGAFDLLIREYADTLDHDVLVVDVSNPAAPQVVDILGMVGTTLTGMGRNPVNGRLFVSNMEARNLEKHVQSLQGHVVDHEVVVLNTAGGPPAVATHVDLHAGIVGFHNVLPINIEARRNSLANPLDIVFNSAGTRAYLAALGPDRVAVLNGTTGNVIRRADVGRGPRGLALDEGRQRLYVLNRTDQTISIVSVATDEILQTGAVSLFNPEPATIRNGRKFLYSTKFSNNYATACATCHIDGHLDHLGWDLGDTAATGLLPSPPISASAPDPCTTVIQGAVLNHPVKGPMVTQSLRGLADHAPFHWRGDKPEFVDFNEAFDNLLGGSELTDAEMGAFDSFIKTVVYSPNPHRNRDNSFKNPAAAGAIGAYSNACQRCHETQSSGTLECDSASGDVAFNLGAVFQTQLVPQLRQLHKKFPSDLYGGFGLLHDGHEKRERNEHPIDTFLIQFFPGLVPLADNMIAFLDAFPTNVAPAVGWQLFVDVPDLFALQPLLEMIGQHTTSPSRCDIVAKGISGADGQMHGYWLASTAGNQVQFEKDDGTFVLLADLFQSATPQNPLVFTAVPPGSGERIGVDQDEDGFRDALDPCPQAKNNGDVNHDGTLDFFDIDPFLAVLFTPGEFDCAADVNASGFIDFFDIDPFLALLFGQ